MERDGWVVRQPDPEDARINLIKPTRRVEQVWEEVSAAGRETLEQAYQGIDPDDLEIAKRVLGQIRKNLIDLHLLL
jgi:DNA-binding MarR family transcriptional regulator